VACIRDQRDPPATGGLRLHVARCQRHDGLLYRRDTVLGHYVLCLPTGTTRQDILTHIHAVELNHLGNPRMLAAVVRSFFWPTLAKDVRKFLDTCVRCAASKPTRRTYGALQPLPTPQRAFDHLTMDFFSTDNHNGLDNVLLVTDRFSKYLFLLPCRTTSTAQDAALLFYTHVYPVTGVPLSITTDRDPLFTSHLWTSFFALLGCKLQFSTPGHAQTDGASERAVQTVRQMLRSTHGPDAAPWPTRLPQIAFAYNSSVHSATGYTPFFLANMREPRIMTTHNSPPDIAADLRPVLDTIADIQPDEAIRADAARHIENAVATDADHHDKRRRPAPDWQPGQRVYVRTVCLGRNAHVREELRLKRKSLPLWAGPFTIRRRVSANVYHVDLPATIHAHRHINVKNLKPVPAGAGEHHEPPPVYVTDEAEYYQPEKIMQHRKRHGRTELLVKWVGYALNRKTDWTPLEHFAHLPTFLAAYFGADAVPTV
jgi:transposase InsO family protein